MSEAGLRIVGDLARLELQPGDRLVLTSNERLTFDWAERMREAVVGWLGGLPSLGDPPKVLILEPGMQLAAVGAPSAAIADIAAERRRQVDEEGWTAEHDDQHQGGELARAAGCYAGYRFTGFAWGQAWPWDRSFWKPKDRRTDLVRAGALIVAEIERLDRAAARAGVQS